MCVECTVVAAVSATATIIQSNPRVITRRSGRDLLGRRFRLGNGAIYTVNAITGPTRFHVATLKMEPLKFMDETNRLMRIKIRIGLLWAAIDSELIMEV